MAFAACCRSMRKCCGAEKWTHHHLSVFLLTFFSYALFHASRKTFSNVKGTIQSEWLPKNETNSSAADLEHFHGATWHRSKYIFTDEASAESFLGTLDSVFLGCYAVGLYISGALGDRFDPRLVLSGGMLVSGALCVCFGSLSEWLQIYNIWWYLLFWGASGFVQASGWPTEVCVMGQWFGHGSRGFVLGLWSACASVGNIIGAWIVSVVLPYGYDCAFLATGTLLMAGSVVIFFTLVSAPRRVGLADADQELSSIEDNTAERAPAINFFKAILLPGVIAYSLAYACLKCVNYSLFFWLPYYLGNNFHWPESEADKMSTYYDWGGILGGIIGGVLTDRLSTRTPVISVMLVCATGSLFAYSHSPNDKLWNGVLMAIAGFFIGGPANLISAAVSADLGRQPQLAGSSEALATVTGLVDGTGSVGAALGQQVVPFVQLQWGWKSVFIVFMILLFMTKLCLLPLSCRESRQLWRRFRERRQNRARSYTPLSIDDIQSSDDDNSDLNNASEDTDQLIGGSTRT